MAYEMPLYFERFLSLLILLAGKCASQLSITVTKYLRKVTIKEERFILDVVQAFSYGK